MTQQPDYKGELRAAYTMRELEHAKRSFHTGVTGLFIRVTLAIIFMYLTVTSYLVLGIAGPMFISVLFLVALFVPYFYQTLIKRLERPRAAQGNRIPGQEAPQQRSIQTHLIGVYRTGGD